MSDGVNTRVRELVKASSVETREAIFEDLVRELLLIYADEKEILLQSAGGELLGYFVPTAREQVGPDPRQAPELDEELQRRLETIDDVIDAEELIRRITQRTGAGSASR
jgi:hypothetical protein